MNLTCTFLVLFWVCVVCFVVELVGELPDFLLAPTEPSCGAESQIVFSRPAHFKNDTKTIGRCPKIVLNGAYGGCMQELHLSQMSFPLHQSFVFS